MKKFNIRYEIARALTNMQYAGEWGERYPEATQYDIALPLSDDPADDEVFLPSFANLLRMRLEKNLLSGMV